MTKEDIKKALECCSNPNTGSCKDCPYNDNDEFHCAYGEMCKDALNLINEQGRIIQMAQDNILSLAQQNQEYREQQVKQAQIDVLNKLKDSYGLYYLSAFGVKERMLADILNPMIEELKK